MATDDDWWEELLDERQADGRSDAGKGVFDPPHPGSDDPQDDMENHAYESGWRQRRKELGESFKWA
jgi:hypothetical protein